MRNFRNLEVYKEAVRICSEVYFVLENMPSSEKYGLRSQIGRSVVSIPSNIAEGASRRTSKEFARFLDISLGSAFELETQLTIAINVKLLPKNNVSTIQQDLEILQKRINALRSSILKNAKD